MSLTAPIMKCTDIETAESFYCDRLGFRVDWRWRHHPTAANPGYTAVSRDGITLHLSSFGGDGAFGSAVYIYVADVDALYADFKTRGLTSFDHIPMDQVHGMRDMAVRDPWQNQLRFGTPLDEA